MLKYSKITNPETKEVSIAASGTQWVISQGYTEQEVEQSDKDGCWYLKGYAPMKTDEEKAQEERQRLDMLNLTKADVLLALYQDKGLSPDDIKAMLKDNIPALIKFDYASSYYRGDEVVNTLGAALGYTTDEIDYLFEHKAFPTEPTKPTETSSDTEQAET